jgi:histone-binding protein RBBP4
MGHSKEGYGLSWNKKKEGYLLSGADDGLACVWDVNDASGLSTSIQALSKF